MHKKLLSVKELVTHFLPRQMEEEKQYTNNREFDKLQSVSIDLLRFPLAILVVFIHCGIHDLANETICETNYLLPLLFLVKVLSLVVQIAVPSFFFISGFLFFHNLTEWEWSIFLDKIKRRVSTILIPYIVWNFITFCIDLLPQVINCIKGKLTIYNIIQYFCSNIIGAFYAGNDGLYPWDFPLWFLRDLMIMMLLSPVFYFLIKRFGAIIIEILTACYILNIWFTTPGFSISAFLFFSSGAYFSVKKTNIICFCEKYKYLILYTTSAILFFALIDFYFEYTRHFFIIGGIFTLFLIASRCNIKYKINANKFLVSSCFFIYSFHAAYVIPLVGSPSFAIQKVLHFLLPGESKLENLTCCIFTPFLTALLSIGILLIMREKLPFLTYLLTGSKVKSLNTCTNSK